MVVFVNWVVTTMLHGCFFYMGSAVCGCMRSSEATPEHAAKLMESLELPREKVQQTQKVQYDKKK